ncbi:MAG TPA: hypothetical protein VKE74_06400 [Gemmataceae bacterium]|nr:hypothetical protein [Gemmataceae bacterium]
MVTPMSMPLVVGALVVVAVLLVVLVLLDVWKRKAGPGARENAKNVGRGLLLVFAVIGGLAYYESRGREREANKPSESAAKVDALMKRLKDEVTNPPQAPAGEDGLTLGAFNRLREGMSYAEVCLILGKRGAIGCGTPSGGRARGGDGRTLPTRRMVRDGCGVTTGSGWSAGADANG